MPNHNKVLKTTGADVPSQKNQLYSSMPKLEPCPLFTSPVQHIANHTAPSTSQIQTLSPCLLFGSVQKVQVKVSELSLGNSGHLTVVGRISHVSDIREWNNAKGQGRALSFQLYDGSAEISVTAFNDKVDALIRDVQFNKVVRVSGFRVKSGDAAYPKIEGQSLELIFGFQGLVEVVDDNGQVPAIPFAFKDIVAIHAQPPGSITDFVGIAYVDEGMVEGCGKDGRRFKFRIIHITDKTKRTYEVKLWGNTAEEFKFCQPCVVVFRRARIEEYDGKKSVSISANTLFLVDSDMSEAKEMIDWFQREKV